MEMLTELTKRASKHFCRIEDKGRFGTFNYVVMTLVGKSLQDLRKGTPQQHFSMGTAIGCGIQTLEALEDLHGIGYLHRDIKPGNYTIGRAELNELRKVYISVRGLKSSGSIELRIDGFSEFVREEQERWSEPIYIRGLEWRILASSIEADKSNIYNEESSFNDLEVYLCCDRWSGNKAWECQADVTLRVVAQKQGVRDIVQQNSGSFGAEFLKSNYPVFCQFATCDMLDPEKGFNEDDTIILQADVELLSVKLSRK
ncbi:MATH domain-containing protein [Ditylenchus destructor]|uniref:non-specific serine/threonine protein kinase n=1 Tax=Ditylenchus destructor TaxID=166010 RepID=A0AAD4MI51_9BILA|nr:MATH domain-containing protein [Ditylenchus destructor]